MAIATFAAFVLTGASHPFLAGIAAVVLAPVWNWVVEALPLPGLPAYLAVLGLLPATIRFLVPTRAPTGLQTAGDRSVRMIGGPEAWTATVCSACAPREPSLLLMVQPSLSMKMSSVLCRNHGSMAMTRPAFSG